MECIIKRDDIVGLCFPDNGRSPWDIMCSISLQTCLGGNRSKISFNVHQGGIRQHGIFASKFHAVNFRKKVMRPLSWLYPELENFTGKVRITFDEEGMTEIHFTTEQ